MGNDAGGRNRKFSDAELRADLESGMDAPAIADKYGASKQAVYARIKQLRLTTTAAVVAPVESQRFVKGQLNLMDELQQSLARIKLLFDAIDSFLRDAKDPTVYDLGPRGTEIIVTYYEPGDETKSKAQLQTLLNRIEERFDVVRSEVRMGDPRTLLLSTSGEIRQITGSMLEIARLLADIEAMQKLQQIVMETLAEENEDIAERVAEKLRSKLVLHSLVGTVTDVSAEADTGGAEPVR